MTNNSDNQRFIQVAQEMQDKRKAHDAMSPEIRESLNKIRSDLSDAFQYIKECNDLRMSDISNLEDALYKLQNMFDTRVSEYWQDQFDKHNITLNDDYSIDVGK